MPQPAQQGCLEEHLFFFFFWKNISFDHIQTYSSIQRPELCGSLQPPHRFSKAAGTAQSHSGHPHIRGQRLGTSHSLTVTFRGHLGSEMDCGDAAGKGWPRGGKGGRGAGLCPTNWGRAGERRCESATQGRARGITF